MNTYFKVLQYARPLFVLSTQYALCSVLFTIFSLANFGLLIPTLDILFNKVESQIVALPEFSFSLDYLKLWFNNTINHKIQTVGTSQTLLYICMFILTSSILRNFFAYINLRIMVKVRVRIIYNLRKAIFQKFLELHILYFSNTRKGDLISRISNDIQEIEHLVISSLVVLFRDPLIAIGYCVVMFIMSVKLTLFTLILIPVSGFLISRISKRLRKQAVDTQNTLASIVSIFEETISGIKVIKVFTAERFLNRQFKFLNQRYTKFLKKIGYRRDLASPISEVMGIAILVIVLIYGGNLILSDNSELSASEFITYLAIFSQIFIPIKGTANALTSIQKGLVSAERVFKIIDAKSEIVDSSDAHVIEDFQHSIVFKNIYMRYEDNTNWAIKDISFEVKKGETIALVGRSGGGKTTLANLLPRFIEPQKGQILIDSKNINTLTVKSLRELMSLVSQEPILFNDTIFNNIAFGLEVLEEVVINAAKITNAHDFIMRTSDGYQTIIGDRGMKLSGGQQQRLSLARAILKNPPILILDEATSALDSQSEKLVQEALNNLLKNRTSIVIAHRLSTIRHAHKILVIDKGQIIEEGTHQKLMDERGFYEKLVRLQ